ncbi:MotA/TolQ/ExbB proton channel family protein [Haloferula sp. A504]|uniref:MotA/TolQ/ExbB proton channel family protein n=1 Tax=Haloferula sp. A504 TaxID=3373601 RepID=UPI0031C0A971|nr:MotA/TolQ/ExbB proton channel family protein [Verrucomicrobiaceae bacterium E54]
MLTISFAHGAVDMDAALENARSDLKGALERLAEVRQAIAEEKPLLAREFEEVELELRQQRRLVRIARTSREDREMEMRELERDRATRERDAGYLAGLLKDHALRIQTVSGPGEPELRVAPEVMAGEADDPAAAVQERLVVLEASLDRLEALMGGSTAPGEAASPTGAVVGGTFAAAGPSMWFTGEGVAGAVVRDRAGARPRVISESPGSVADLVAGKEVVLGLDVTGGKARALEEVGGGPLALIRKGGLWIWPILFLAVLSFAFGVVKLIGFARYRDPGEAWVGAISGALRGGDAAKAAELASRPSHPAAEVMTTLVERASSPVELVEETLYEKLMGVQQKAGSLLPVIAVTAATAPLLGLLGTVSGMIRTFNLITLFGSGDPKPLAGGISEALVTTLFGLIVAIPALILHAFLARRSQGIVQTTERLGLSFINSLRKE